MIPHHIVFVHGIGDALEGYSEWLQREIFASFAQSVARLTGEKPPHDSIHFKETLWSRVTQGQQDALWNRLFDWLPTDGRPMRKRRPYTEIIKDVRRRPKLSLKKFANQLKYWSWFRKTVIVYQGDLIAYIESPGENKYVRIHDIVFGAIDDCMKVTKETEATGQNPALVTIVGHSLGSVIVSDVFYDALENKNRWWPAQLRLANFFSLGCPLSLYTLRYKKDTEQEFQKPIRMQDLNGLWINMYDAQDIVGYPMKRLNDAYREAVCVDKEIRLGHWWNLWHLLLRWTPFNHYIYLEDYTVAELIGKKAALDWLQTNRPELRPQLKVAYETYKKNLE